MQALIIVTVLNIILNLIGDGGLNFPDWRKSAVLKNAYQGTMF